MESDKAVDNVLIVAFVQGRDSHWWEEPVVSGNPKSMDERIKATRIVTKTDLQGQFRITGSGVFLGISAIVGTNVYGLYRSRIEKTTSIPDKLEITPEGYCCPLSDVSLEGIREDPLIVELFDKLKNTHCEFSGVVEDESGIALRNVPYELRKHEDGSVIEQYVTDSYGGIKTVIAIGVKVDVFLRPNARNWPGQSSRRPEFMPEGLTDLWVEEVDGCQQGVGLQAIDLKEN